MGDEPSGQIAHCHAVFTVLKVYLCLVGRGLTLSLCCGMSVALIRFSKKVETVSASLHLMNESHVSFTFQLFCVSVNCLLLLWKKKNPWQLYSLPLKPSQSVAASYCWCGAGEGVTHHCGADLGNITVLVKTTMTPSIVWMGSVGHMVSPRPLPLWRHAKWFCTKLGITVYFYAAFVCGWISVSGWLQCLSGSHCFFLCLRSGDICGRGHYVIFFFFSRFDCPSICPSHSHEHGISGIPWGNFFGFATNVNLTSRMSWLHLSSQRSLWPHGTYFWP